MNFVLNLCFTFLVCILSGVAFARPVGGGGMVPAAVSEYGFDHMVAANPGAIVLFTGELKDEEGPFQFAYSHAPAPTKCGMFETKDDTVLMDPMHQHAFLPGPRKESWKLVVDTVSSKNLPHIDDLNIYSEKSEHLIRKIIVNNSVSPSVHIRFITPKEWSFHSGEETRFVVNFLDGKPVSYEERFYPHPDKVPEKHKFFHNLKASKPQTDEDGAKYFLHYKCENEVTS